MTERQVKPMRRRLFLVMTWVLPLTFFAALEGVLRAVDFGTDYPLFVASPRHPEYLLANPEVVKRFFADERQAPAVRIETAFFRADKPPGSFRVFVQGGSSAAGFPYGYGASLAGMLERRLRRSYPERDIEVVGTAMAAVNSYAMLDFTAEILAQEPDLVLVYAGHNEFLGIHGVGSALSSSHSRHLTLLAMRLRRFDTYQLLERLYLAVAGSSEVGSETGRKPSLMARVAGERAIPYESRLYERGLEQFGGNLGALLARYERAGVPVLVGTLASNERDQAPFVGGPMAQEDAEQWRVDYERAAAAFADGRYDEALAAIQSAVGSDDRAADAFYLQGRILQAMEREGAAREAYLAAKDRDQLRFRAPEAFNSVIREAADEHGARVVDVQQALLSASPGGSIGKEMMLEHLHPTLDGYFILAEAYFDAIVASELLGAPQADVGRRQARAEVPVSETDRLFGEYKAARIVSDWPFRQPPVEPSLPEPHGFAETLAQQLYRQEIDWARATDRLKRHYLSVGDDLEFTRVALILADAFPFMAGPQYDAGTALIRNQRHREALRYLHRAARLDSRNVNHLLALSHAFILNGHYTEGRETLQRVLELDPDNATATKALADLERKASGERP